MENITFKFLTNMRIKYYIGRICVRALGLKKPQSYSMINEDNIIDWLTGYKQNGVYVDVGANNPDHSNNTRLFYERGWRGVNIEPNIDGFNQFVAKRPDDVNINEAVGIGYCDYYENPNDTYRNTCMKSWADKWVGTEWEMKHKRTVKLKPLAEIFYENKLDRVDFMKIDVETFEHEVLRSNDWNKYRPTVLCLEGSGYGYLKKYGYRWAFWDGFNTYYKLK